MNATEDESLFILSENLSKSGHPAQKGYRSAADAMRAAREAMERWNMTSRTWATPLR
ncbi:hypothetical protein Ga0080559_TMP3025 [Salipiger profundus]|uniref:Uncharacterized protein n=1 Tax=Salipiger profundus TaxID=1229727 RepID=A0A1U7D6P1_9RHOB|nr:hypothetical protein Ga0080559_TMP3025 [Salipiger profundus]